MDTFPKIAQSVVLEHQIAQLMSQQKTTGWPFDVAKAQELENQLLTELEKLKKKAENICHYVPHNLFTPKRDNKKQGYYAGCEMQRLKDFNPSSREHIAWWFKTFQDWTPTKLTPTGKAVIDETVLKEIGTEEALVFLNILVIQKKLGMLSQGTNAWLKLVKDGRLHHSCFIGAVTHRMAHSHPNLAQVSSDKDCRELFITNPTWKLVDSDLAGIELRLFAHYLHRYDGGRYAKILLEQDIHQVNAEKLESLADKSRQLLIVSCMEGATRNLDYLLTICSPRQSEEEGAEIRRAYMDAIPGLEDLVKDTRRVAERGSIRAIDKRQIIVDKEHKALNCLLQGSAAVIAKRWLLLTDHNLRMSMFNHERYAFVHDEQVLGAPHLVAHDVAEVCKISALQAGEYYNIRLPIEADAQVGDNWAEVH